MQEGRHLERGACGVAGSEAIVAGAADPVGVRLVGVGELRAVVGVATDPVAVQGLNSWTAKRNGSSTRGRGRVIFALSGEGSQAWATEHDVDAPAILRVGVPRADQEVVVAVGVDVAARGDVAAGQLPRACAGELGVGLLDPVLAR